MDHAAYEALSAWSARVPVARRARGVRRRRRPDRQRAGQRPRLPSLDAVAQPPLHPARHDSRDHDPDRRRGRRRGPAAHRPLRRSPRGPRTHSPDAPRRPEHRARNNNHDRAGGRCPRPRVHGRRPRRQPTARRPQRVPAQHRAAGPRGAGPARPRGSAPWPALPDLRGLPAGHQHDHLKRPRRPLHRAERRQPGAAARLRRLLRLGGRGGRVRGGGAAGCPASRCAATPAAARCRRCCSTRPRHPRGGRRPPARPRWRAGCGTAGRAWRGWPGSAGWDAGRSASPTARSPTTWSGSCLVNVVQQLDHLMAHPSVARRVSEGALALHGMYFHVAEAQAYLLDRTTKCSRRCAPTWAWRPRARGAQDPGRSGTGSPTGSSAPGATGQDDGRGLLGAPGPTAKV